MERHHKKGEPVFQKTYHIICHFIKNERHSPVEQSQEGGGEGEGYTLLIHQNVLIQIPSFISDLMQNIILGSQIIIILNTRVRGPYYNYFLKVLF